MRNGGSEDCDGRGAFGPQTLKRHVHAPKIALAGRIADRLDPSFGLVAEDCTHVHEFGAVAGPDVKHQLLDFSPCNTAIGAEPRYRVVERLGADLNVLRF